MAAPGDPNRNAFLELIENRALLDGRFSNIRRIDPTGGNGTFSLIFAATDTMRRQEVALKFYHPDHRHDGYRWASFEREAQILESLSGQRDIVSFVSGRSEFVETLPAGSVSITIPFAYYAMELAASDMGIITAMGIWDAERLLCAFRSMCRGVQRIHARGISHRDLKPRNFLVSRSGEVRLSDFGTARQVADGHALQLAASYSGPPGDLRYAAPELLACLHDDDPRISLRGDIYSLGAILFEMFTGIALGHLVFDQSSLTDLILLMSAAKRGQRQQIYDGFVSTMAGSHPLPDIAEMGSPVPGCVVQRIDRLYKSMAAIDYRSRLCDFERVFWQIDTSLLVLRNEAKFRRWREEKRKRRLAVSTKLRAFGVSR